MLILLVSPVFSLFAVDYNTNYNTNTSYNTYSTTTTTTSNSSNNNDMILVASWMWKTDDKIKKFRFKVNNSDPSYWDHVVNGDVTTHSIRGVKPGEVYTLYLQQSYDGENWSDTAISVLEVR